MVALFLAALCLDLEGVLEQATRHQSPRHQLQRRISSCFGLQGTHTTWSTHDHVLQTWQAACI